MADAGVMDPKGGLVGESESARRLREQVGVLKEDVREFGRLSREVSQEKLEALEDSVVRYVREKPVKSLCIALGAGALLGYLLSRR
jgi:ElaB/YqjD/DUF883 family membrane-anchored ribosome-binding protein